MQIEIEIQGLDKAKKVFNQLQEFATAEYQKRVMTIIGEMTRTKIEESFKFKKSPFGENWQPLKPSTIKAKKGKGDILSFSGVLADKWNIEATNTRVGVFGIQLQNHTPTELFINTELQKLVEIEKQKSLQEGFCLLMIVELLKMV